MNTISGTNIYSFITGSTGDLIHAAKTWFPTGIGRNIDHPGEDDATDLIILHAAQIETIQFCSYSCCGVYRISLDKGVKGLVKLMKTENQLLRQPDSNLLAVSLGDLVSPRTVTK